MSIIDIPQIPLTNTNNDCHMITTLHLLAQIKDRRLFNQYFLDVLEYIRGIDKHRNKYIEFMNQVKNRLKGQQYDPNEDIEDLFKYGYILNSRNLSMILISPGKASNTLQDLICNKIRAYSKYIIIGIQRNENGKSKNKTPIKLNEILNINNALYKLKAIIIHCGPSVNNGHYIVFLNYNNMWFLYDDNKEPLLIGSGFINFVQHPYKCGCCFMGIMKNTGTVMNDSTTILLENLFWNYQD